MTTCDFCDAEFAEADRRVAHDRRPSDPTEVVALMWACPPCGTSLELPTPAELHRQLEAGELPGVLFITV